MNKISINGVEIEFDVDVELVVEGTKVLVKAKQAAPVQVQREEHHHHHHYPALSPWPYWPTWIPPYYVPSPPLTAPAFPPGITITWGGDTAVASGGSAHQNATVSNIAMVTDASGREFTANLFETPRLSASLEAWNAIQ